jgi:hypothetical protein
MLSETQCSLVLLQLLDLDQILNISTAIAAGFLDVAKCNILPTLTGQVGVRV